MKKIMHTLIQGSYFEVGAVTNREIYRVMKICKTTIHIMKVNALSTTIRKIKHFEETYDQEVYHFKILHTDQGDALLLQKIIEKIKLIDAIRQELKELKETISVHFTTKRKKLIKLKQIITNNLK